MNAREKKLAIVTALIVVVGGSTVFLGDDGPPPPASAAAPAPTTSSAPSAPAATNNAGVERPVAALFRRDDLGALLQNAGATPSVVPTFDPFVERVAAKGTKVVRRQKGEFKVTGVYRSGGVGGAVIDGKILYEGDVVDDKGTRLVRVLADAVILHSKGQEYRVELDPLRE